MRLISKPLPGEYASYAEMYIKLVPSDGMLLEHLENNFLKIKQFITSLPEEKLFYRYEKDKWSIKEILVHIIDDERIYCYRALRFARNEKQELSGFDQDAYALYSGADERSVESIFEEYEAVRRATITLFKYLPDESFLRIGRGKDSFQGASVRALAYHIAGHELHHFNYIRNNYL